jgi:UDP-3-O-[3-hydroxymyristoyl] glucosamine N-acyltransferase
MADPRFFVRSSPITLEKLASLAGASMSNAISSAVSLEDVAALDQATAHQVSFLDNPKYLGQYEQSKAGACFVREKYAARAPKTMALLITETPYTAYALAAQYFYPFSAKPGVSPHAHIATSATIGNNCSIAPGVVIGDGCVIGDNCVIGANSTISHAIIGSRVIIHRGVHIGQDGFGFAPGPRGILKVPQLGRVMIGDDVEIGSGSCIDRGAGPDTVIEDGCKIDNLVQIGHNVQLGKMVVIAAGCGIAGSTKIGDGTMLAGQVGIAGHLTIGRGVKIAGQAGVVTDVPDGMVYGGSPAVPIKDWHRQTALLAKLVSKKE